MSQVDASETLLELIFEAAETALDTRRHKEPLVPFTLLLTKGGTVKQRYIAETTRAAIDKAQRALLDAGSDTLAYVLAYDGYVTIEDAETDAIMLEAGERGKRSGLRLAQRYRPALAAMPLMPIGNLAYLGVAEHYLETNVE